MKRILFLIFLSFGLNFVFGQDTILMGTNNHQSIVSNYCVLYADNGPSQPHSPRVNASYTIKATDSTYGCKIIVYNPYNYYISKLSEYNIYKGDTYMKYQPNTSNYHYDYKNKCDCSEDDKCGCDFPNNMPHNFTQDYNEKTAIYPKIAILGKQAPNFIAPAILGDNTIVQHFNLYKYVKNYNCKNRRKTKIPRKRQ